MKIVRVALAGFGNVGRRIGVLLLSRREHYRRVYEIDVRLVAVCGSRAGVFDAAGLEAGRFDRLEAGRCGPDFVASCNADLLIEAGPSNFRTGLPGGNYLRSALSAGCDAIVISKGALVHDGPNLRRLAARTGATLKISGATAAALPAIDLLNYNLRGCTVLEVEGILNATTNYLLDAMTVRGIGFETALKEAQAGGFAERDPRDDVDGWDTACKLVILANFGLGADLAISEMPVRGIQHITDVQIDTWRTAGLTPKLVGRLTRNGETITASVGVCTYPSSDVFAHVSGKNKAIRVTTDVMGQIVAIGGGAEPTATAAAALKDLEHILEAH